MSSIARRSFTNYCPGNMARALLNYFISCALMALTVALLAHQHPDPHHSDSIHSSCTLCIVAVTTAADAILPATPLLFKKSHTDILFTITPPNNEFLLALKSRDPPHI